MFGPFERGDERNNRPAAAEMADTHSLIPAYLNTGS
jgi:hypothetical protein